MAPARSQRHVLGRNHIHARRTVGGIGGQGQPFAVGQDLDGNRDVIGECIGEPFDEDARDILLGHFRKAYHIVGAHDVDRIGIAAHDIARHVVGDDPVGTLAFALSVA